MSAITNQRAKTTHILLTYTVNSCCAYIKVAGSHFTYITVILEHPLILPIGSLLFAQFFLFSFFYEGGEGKCKEKHGGLSPFFFFKTKINQVISH